jgi:uncharacterized protein YkwD
MARRLSFAALLLAAAIYTPVVIGQKAEEHAVERIAVPDVPDASGKRPDLAEAAKKIVEQTNALRKKEGRKPVATATKLTDTAKYFADHMARNDAYGHRADGNSPDDRVKRHEYQFCLIAENIAYAFDSRGFDVGPLADQFATGWEKSPPHRENMLDPDVTETGVAVARSEKTGHYYAVQLFARPKSEAIVFKVHNQSGETVSYAIGDRAFDLTERMIRTHTQCRPAELKFTWPGDKTATAKPAGGDVLIVTKDQAGFAVKKK